MRRLFCVFALVISFGIFSAAWAAPHATTAVEILMNLAKNPKTFGLDYAKFDSTPGSVSIIRLTKVFEAPVTRRTEPGNSLYLWLSPSPQGKWFEPATEHAFRLTVMAQEHDATELQMKLARKIAELALERAGIRFEYEPSELAKIYNHFSTIHLESADDFQRFMSEIDKILGQIATEGHGFLLN